jgi:hypothetical protein
MSAGITKATAANIVKNTDAKDLSKQIKNYEMKAAKKNVNYDGGGNAPFPGLQPLKLNFGELFQSGTYTIKNKNLLFDKLDEIGDYISTNPNSDYNIEIEASESEVPNYDAETPGKPKLDKGELAKKRAEVAKTAIEKYFGSLKAFTGKINVKIKTKIGGPKWDPTKGDKASDQKFTEHQYVNVTVSADAKDPFASYSSKGEGVYKGNNLFAKIFYKTSKSNDITSQGNVNTGTEDVLLRLLKKDTQGYFIKSFIIPSKVWNNKQGQGNSITDEDLENFQQYEVGNSTGLPSMNENFKRY